MVNMNNPEKQSDEYFDNITKDILEKDLLEEFINLEEERNFANDPDYSNGYKQFINKLVGKKLYDVNKEKRIKFFGGAALCACFIIALSISSVADIKNIIRNLFITYDSDSTHISEYDMNIDYDLDSVPESWEYIYVPEYLPAGFTVESFESDDKEINIVFSNPNNDRIEYILYKEYTYNTMENQYEIIDNNGTNIYYTEDGDTRTVICKVTDIYIKIFSNYIGKEELLQIMKNIKVLNR